VSCLSLPTPWAVGPVNVYLLEDDPLTLIDTGQADAAAVEALERGLATRGRRIEDLGRVVLTHQHVDHWGLARSPASTPGWSATPTR
jgi:glyoxylase-like metal-dependent hydrolase (beta-lactamase superfamily II)